MRDDDAGGEDEDERAERREREALAAGLDEVVATLQLAAPDLTVGVAIYTDYGLSRPFTLAQQQTTAWPALSGLLDVVPEEAPLAVGFEALVQAGGGYGYDCGDRPYTPHRCSARVYYSHDVFVSRL